MPINLVVKPAEAKTKKRYTAIFRLHKGGKVYKRAGLLSYYILWGDKTNLTDAVKDYKKRFKLS